MARSEIDFEISKATKRQLNRRSSDTAGVQVSVSYSVVYLSGEIKSTRALGCSMKDEVDALRTVLMKIHGVKDVVTTQLRITDIHSG